MVATKGIAVGTHFPKNTTSTFQIIGDNSRKKAKGKINFFYIVRVICLITQNNI